MTVAADARRRQGYAAAPSDWISCAAWKGVWIQREERVDELWIELPSSFFDDVGAGAVMRPRFSVGSLVSEHVEDVGERHDPGGPWDRRCAQAVWVALAIPPFMMRASDRFGELHQRRGAAGEDLRPDRRVATDNVPFGGAEWALLEEDLVWYRDLADVVQAGRAIQRFTLLGREPDGGCDHARQTPDPPCVQRAFVIAELRCVCEPFEDIHSRAVQFPLGAPRAQCLIPGDSLELERQAAGVEVVPNA